MEQNQFSRQSDGRYTIKAVPFFVTNTRKIGGADYTWDTDGVAKLCDGINRDPRNSNGMRLVIGHYSMDESRVVGYCRNARAVAGVAFCDVADVRPAVFKEWTINGAYPGRSPELATAPSFNPHSAHALSLLGRSQPYFNLNPVVCKLSEEQMRQLDNDIKADTSFAAPVQTDFELQPMDTPLIRTLINDTLAPHLEAISKISIDIAGIKETLAGVTKAVAEATKPREAEPEVTDAGTKHAADDDKDDGSKGPETGDQPKDSGKDKPDEGDKKSEFAMSQPNNTEYMARKAAEFEAAALRNTAEAGALEAELVAAFGTKFADATTLAKKTAAELMAMPSDQRAATKTQILGLAGKTAGAPFYQLPAGQLPPVQTQTAPPVVADPREVAVRKFVKNFNETATKFSLGTFLGKSEDDAVKFIIAHPELNLLRE